MEEQVYGKSPFASVEVSQARHNQRRDCPSSENKSAKEANLGLACTLQIKLLDPIVKAFIIRPILPIDDSSGCSHLIAELLLLARNPFPITWRLALIRWQS